jgi:flagellar hook-associated protein 3 FlgL
LEEALGLAIDAIEEIPDIRSRIGSDRLVLETMKVRHLDFIVFTNESVNKIESVDVAAAVSRMSIDQVQLEASYMLTARLSQLSLANFLR